MPVSASGDRLARSSMAMRTSSSQSMSSGVEVTSPSFLRFCGIKHLILFGQQGTSPQKCVSRRERPFAIG